ncbi:THAP domain-containing 1-like [Pelobates cultripes]|uniref:THAP domain-containing 1-like n=1 Tax=Pelobates cultripes TaxID=61616 RepID=A0AAD1WDZ3_PELCU|nr:THAP domain-containing 1-like [Pelobates cultripes]
MPRCLVKSCTSKQVHGQKTGAVAMHLFPKSPSKIKLWMENIGQKFEDMDATIKEIVGAKRGCYRICSAHFTRDSFEQIGSRRFLKKNAAPTIFQDYDGCSIAAPVQTQKHNAVNRQTLAPTAGNTASIAANTSKLEAESDGEREEFILSGTTNVDSWEHCYSGKPSQMLQGKGKVLKKSVGTTTKGLLKSKSVGMWTGPYEFFMEEVSRSTDEISTSKAGKCTSAWTANLQQDGREQENQKTSNVKDERENFVTGAPFCSMENTNVSVKAEPNDETHTSNVSSCSTADDILHDDKDEKGGFSLDTSVVAGVPFCSMENTNVSVKTEPNNEIYIPNTSSYNTGDHTLHNVKDERENTNVCVKVEPNDKSYTHNISSNKTGDQTLHDVKDEREDFTLHACVGTAAPFCSMENTNISVKVEPKDETYTPNIGSSAIRDHTLHDVKDEREHFSLDAGAVIGAPLCLTENTNVSVKTEPDDETHTPNTSSYTAADDTLDDSDTSAVEESKFIVFESSLDLLIQRIRCAHRGICERRILKKDKIITGSCLTVLGTCEDGHVTELWRSQPLVNKIPLRNVIYF